MLHETHFWDYAPRNENILKETCAPPYSRQHYSGWPKVCSAFLWRWKKLNELLVNWYSSQDMENILSVYQQINGLRNCLIYIYIWIYTHICIYTHTCIHTHTRICIYVWEHTHTVELFSMKRRNLAIGTSAVIWKDSEGITLCKIRQKRKTNTAWSHL